MSEQNTRTRLAAVEIEDKVLDAVRRWQGSEKYPGGLTATDIGRFVRGLGAAEVKRCADGLVKAPCWQNTSPGGPSGTSCPRRSQTPNRREVEKEGETGEKLYAFAALATREPP